MAIVDMSKITIIGLESEKKSIMRYLMKEGFVQVDDASLTAEEDLGELQASLTRDGNDAFCVEMEQDLYQMNQALGILKTFHKEKKKLFAEKLGYQKPTEKEIEAVWNAVESILEKNKSLASIKSKISQLQTSCQLLEPWRSFDIPLDQMSTKHARVILATLPGGNVETVRSQLEEQVPEAFLGSIRQDKNGSLVYLITHREKTDEAVECLRAFDFSPVSFPDFKGTVQENITRLEKEIAQQKEAYEATVQEIIGLASQKAAIENLYDYDTIRLEEMRTTEKLLKTEASFYLKGWVPTKKADNLVKELAQKYRCYIETQKATAEDNYPVLLENNALVTPFESITNMYSCPSPKDIDPNKIMSVFFLIFFGIMMGDAGYGLLITIACFIYVKKAKLPKGEGNLIKMMGLCGVSTTIFGFLMGSFFGFSTPGLINPLENVMFLMAASLILGLIHIYVGLGIKGYMLLRDKDVVSFICDIVLWYIFITGVCLVIVPIVAGDIGIFAEIGKYLAIIGAIGIILTGGRSFKGIIVKLFKGVTSLYGITSYFGDVLSYTRLMALCLSSGVIAQVINLLGEMTGPVPAIFIGIAGHAINLFIGALGAYVHTSRLQFVEFFGKFYEGGGIPFTPFRLKTKYTKINKEEM